MTTFEYLSVFISIVIGLAVVRVLGGVGTILDRGRRGTYWVHTAWVGYFTVWLPYFWWFTFDWRREETWTFPVFFFVVLFAMLAYLSTFVLVPTADEDVSDLRGYFYRVRPQFFLLQALLVCADVVDTMLKPGNLEDVGPTYLPLMAAVIAGHLIAARTRNERYHQFWVLLIILVFATFSLRVYADVFSAV